MGRADVLARVPIAVALASLASVASLGGCSGVLGLDAPFLDPCVTSGAPNGTCSEGGVLADASSSGSGGDGSVAQDGAGSDAVVPVDGSVDGVRCGGGSFPVTGCNHQTPTCCQESSGDGGASYVCVASPTDCSGYPIACASNADCSGNDVCCHFNSGTKCENESVCSSPDSLVCEPSGPPDQCPSGWHCTGTVVDDGVQAPYFVCSR